MKDTFSTKYIGGMAFEADIEGKKIVMDADSSVGGEDKGPKPKPLIMAALTGCTGMDIVSILKKMQVEYDSFDMKVEFEMTDEHPKTYTKFHLIYEFVGKELDEKKINKAVNLSQDRYCGVVSLLKKALELTHEIKLIEK